MKNFTNFDLNRGIIIPLNQIIIPFYQLFTSQYSTNSVTGAKLCEAPNILDVGKSVASSKSNLINKINKNVYIFFFVFIFIFIYLIFLS